jgi:hypothetical protein
MKPILLSGPMVRATMRPKDHPLRKTETRRVFRLNRRVDAMEVHFSDGEAWASIDGDPWQVPCPYGQHGDVLGVREAWRTVSALDRLPPRALPSGAPVWYDADLTATGESLTAGDPAPGYQTLTVGKGRPSIHMPWAFVRLRLNVEAVRVERLHDIDDAGARAEGVADVAEYRELWERINGAGSWDVNPWVWVVAFEAVTP